MWLALYVGCDFIEVKGVRVAVLVILERERRHFLCRNFLPSFSACDQLRVNSPIRGNSVIFRGPWKAAVLALIPTNWFISQFRELEPALLHQTPPQLLSRSNFCRCGLRYSPSLSDDKEV